MVSQVSTFPTFVRLHPGDPHEVSAQLQISNREIKVSDQTHYFTQSVDNILPPSCSQADVFACVAPYVSRVAKGYNTAVIAYGETGSGKTYTLYGNNDGIVFRAISQLFRDLSPNLNQGRRYDVLVSNVLIHKEKMYDLLESNPLMSEIAVSEYSGCGITIEGLTEMVATDAKKCLEIVERGQHGRSQVEAQIPSSRSHVILHVKIESQRVCRHGTLRKMRLTFCDLAGSEKEPLGAKDALSHSLNTFHSVMALLASGGTAGYIPYRESKLTTLLQHALHPSCHTCFVYTVSPALKSIEMTIDTLKKVSKTASIPLIPEKRTIQVDEELKESLREEVNTLRESLQRVSPKNASPKQKGKGKHQINEVEELLETLHEFRFKLENAQQSPGANPAKETRPEGGDNRGWRKESKLSAGEGRESPGPQGWQLPTSLQRKPGAAFHTPSTNRAGIRSSVSPVSSRVEQTPSRHDHFSLDLSFDQMVVQTGRTRNDKREKHQVSFRKAVQNSRQLNSVQSDMTSMSSYTDNVGVEVSEEVKLMIQAQLRKFEEEREANRKKLEMKIQKEMQDKESFRKKLERRPAIEPRMRRPNQAADRLKRLLE